MKTLLVMTAMSFFFHLQTNANVLEKSLPMGSKVRIIKICELPDIKEFQLKDGTFYDIGSMYEIKHIFGLSFYNSDAEYIGYINSRNKYVEITEDELNTIIATTRIRLPEEASITFFDNYISKPLLLLLITGIGYSSRKYLIKRKTERLESEESEISSWPPNTIP